MTELTQARLKELLHYDPETGLFTRLVRTAKRTKIGEIPGSTDSNGYIQISIDYKRYQAHHLAFSYMTGTFPDNQLDHIDGIRSNNKWINLRECTNAENQQDLKKAMKNNKSTGLLGVYKSGEKFMAQIMLNKKSKYLGTFKTKDDAHQAYINAKRELHEFGTL